MILVDSSVWIDYFSGNETLQVKHLDSILEKELIVTGDLILTEVLQGFTTDKDFKAAKILLSHLIYFDLLNKDIAIKSAENYRFLRKRGVIVRKTIDVIIGTFCIENDLMLLHSDKDFSPMEIHLGLKVFK
jgi:predicted nucleic acid-binding protein